MDKKVLKKRMKSWFALVLALGMMFGSSLTVFAKTIPDISVDTAMVVNETTLCGGDVIQTQTSGNYIKLWIDGVLVRDELDNNDTNYIIPGTSDKEYLLTGFHKTNNNGGTPDRPSYNYEIRLSTITKSEPKSEPEPEPHVHSYSWVTVQEATTEQDGIEEYRCSCGAVAERSVIPASQVFVKGLYGEIKNAPLNGTVTFDSGRLYTMSDYIVKKLAERSDVTTVVTFEYNKTAYRMTIPAGADYSALLADEDYFYGYFYFAQLVGATIEEV